MMKNDISCDGRLCWIHAVFIYVKLDNYYIISVEDFILGNFDFYGE